MPAPALAFIPWLISFLTAIGAWIAEMVLMYGKKLAFFSVIVSMFFGTLYTISSTVFAAFDGLAGSAAFGALLSHASILTSIWPSNFQAIVSLIITTEFSIFVWRWAQKVLDIKVHFFGS
jgi:hypothetical protein